MKKLLHIAAEKAHPEIWTDAFRAALAQRGELTIVEDGNMLSEAQRIELIQDCHVLLTSWGSSPVPVRIGSDCGSLEYICHVTGTLQQYIPFSLIEAGIPVTNWGDAPAKDVAEGAMTLLLATLKDLHYRVQLTRSDGWEPDPRGHGGSLEGLNVGVYGYGVIGRRFVDLIRPFEPVIRIYDPYAKQFPPDCIVVHSLDDLFGQSEAIVIHAALTDQTRGSVTAGLLARLPNHGIVVNTARGGIIDQEALFRELERGRLRAGLDVLEPDYLPPGHPARRWENLILTSHRISMGWPVDDVQHRLSRIHQICLANLDRHLSGQPLQFMVDQWRYRIST